MKRSTGPEANVVDLALGEVNDSENWLYKIRDAGCISPRTAELHVAKAIKIE